MKGTDLADQPAKNLKPSKNQFLTFKAYLSYCKGLRMTPKVIFRGSLTEGRSNPIPRGKETLTSTHREWCIIDIDTDSFAWDEEI